jgi:murein DD-endopeptidase MepM/ murein hydrolase activator NlpD
MKKLFYFSKPSLKYVEIRNFKLKLFAVVIVLSILLSASFIIVYYFLGIGSNPLITIYSLKTENKELKKEIKRLAENYQEMAADIDSISILNRELRVYANLQPVSDEERLFGFGGGEDYPSYLRNIKDYEIEAMLTSIDEMINTFKFEKYQSIEITDKINMNEELFACIPALKPSFGTYSVSGFGMRNHPILGVRKFHSGLDINCNTGSSVHSPGNGKVTAVERRSGFGLVVEINHGFGYKTVFAHLSKALVKRGELVTRGQLIAKSGNTGFSSGPHLHYEVHHNGKALDPIDFFFDDLSIFDFDTSNSSLSEK